jgi:hypothetical protein
MTGTAPSWRDTAKTNPARKTLTDHPAHPAPGKNQWPDMPLEEPTAGGSILRRLSMGRTLGATRPKLNTITIGQFTIDRLRERCRWMDGEQKNDEEQKGLDAPS